MILLLLYCVLTTSHFLSVVVNAMVVDRSTVGPAVLRVN